MTFRSLVLAHLGQLRRTLAGLRGEQARQAAQLDQLLAEQAAQGETLRQILAEVSSPAPAGSVTITVGPVSDIST